MDVKDTLRRRRQQPSFGRPPRLAVKRLLVVVVVRVGVMVTFGSLVLRVAVPVNTRKKDSAFPFLTLLPVAGHCAFHAGAIDDARLGS